MMRQVARRISDNLTSPPAKWFDCHKTLTVCVRGNTGIEHESRRFRDIELIWRDGGAAPPASTLPKGVQKYLASAIRLGVCAGHGVLQGGRTTAALRH